MKPHILFVVDAGPEVGGGHVMRSLTLARMLTERWATCAFLNPPAVDGVLAAFAPDMAREEAPSTERPALIRASEQAPFDAVVFDHYSLARPDHEAIAKGRPSLVIDDLADRPLGGDLVLDSGPARRAEDYAEWVDPKTRLLLGPAYAPVRPEFAALRDAALARRGGPVARVLVSLGLTDLGSITARVVDRLRPRLGGATLDIVLGAGAPSLSGLSRVAAHDKRLTVHVDSTNMAGLTAQADIAIGAAGSTTWERCTLGLPSALLILADNQRGAAAAVAEFGAALVVDPTAADFDAALDRAMIRLMTDAALRARLSAASAAACDGLGAGRVAEAFLQTIAELRP